MQIMAATQAIAKLTQYKLPMRLAWKVATAVSVLSPLEKTVNDTAYNTRISYAIRKDDGSFVQATDTDGQPIPNTMQIPPDKITILNQELDELLAQTVEVHNTQFNLSEFPETMEIEPSVFVGLGPFLINDAPPELSLVK